VKDILIGVILTLLFLAGWNIWQDKRAGAVQPQPTEFGGLTIPMPTRGGEAQPPIDMGPIYAAQTEQAAKVQATMTAMFEAAATWQAENQQPTPTPLILDMITCDRTAMYKQPGGDVAGYLPHAFKVHIDGFNPDMSWVRLHNDNAASGFELWVPMSALCVDYGK
jgi:hypothetical protein